MARPSDYTKELGDEICAQLSEGLSLKTVCASEDRPAASTVFRWIRTNDEFRNNYARAKEEASDALIEEMLDIADDGSNDFMTITKGDVEYEIENKEVTNRSRLRVDTRKWIASKLKPKKYGDKLDLTSGGDKLPQPIINVHRDSGNTEDKEPQ